MANVSIIIPTYGNPIFLANSIHSVLRQTFQNIELIIVDDNNPESEARSKTEQVISQFNDSRIKYVQHDINKNGAAARNTGLRHSSGKYIGFLDSDDEYMPTRVAKCLEGLRYSGKNIAGIYSGCEFRRAGKTYNKFKNVKSGNFLVETLACSFMFCSGSNIFIKRDVIEELNGFDEKFLRHQDYEFLVRLFKKYDLLAIPEILIVKNNENFNLPDCEKQIAIKKQYFEKFSEEIKSLTDKERDYIFHHNAVVIAENALVNRKYKIACDYYKKANRHSSLTLKDLFRAGAITLRSMI